ncbi:MAG: cupin domain-containing protein [Acidobacteriaceae bacterium]
MKRRTLLTSAATALPLAFAGPLAKALAPAQTSPQIHVVPADADRFGQTYAPGYAELVFKTDPADSSGALFAVEHTHMLPGFGPALHLHYHQDEWFYVIEGEVQFQVGDQRVRLKSGESVLGPRNIPHAFTPIHPSRMLITFTPAGQMAQFFRDTASLGPKQGPEVYSRYGMKRVGPPIIASESL